MAIIGDQLIVQGPFPVEQRAVVNDKSTIASGTVFKGMVAYDISDDTLYVFIGDDLGDPAVDANWEEVGSGTTPGTGIVESVTVGAADSTQSFNVSTGALTIASDYTGEVNLVKSVDLNSALSLDVNGQLSTTGEANIVKSVDTSGALALDNTGALSSTGEANVVTSVDASGALALDANGQLSTTGEANFVKSVPGSGVLSVDAAGQLSSTGEVNIVKSVDSTGALDLDSNGNLTTTGEANIVKSVDTTGALALDGNGALSTTGEANVVKSVDTTGALALDGNGELSTTGEVNVVKTVTLGAVDSTQTWDPTTGALGIAASYSGTGGNSISADSPAGTELTPSITKLISGTDITFTETSAHEITINYNGSAQSGNQIIGFQASQQVFDAAGGTVVFSIIGQTNAEWTITIPDVTPAGWVTTSNFSATTGTISGITSTITMTIPPTVIVGSNTVLVRVEDTNNSINSFELLITRSATEQINSVVADPIIFDAAGGTSTVTISGTSGTQWTSSVNVAVPLAWIDDSSFSATSGTIGPSGIDTFTITIPPDTLANDSFLSVNVVNDNDSNNSFDFNINRDIPANLTSAVLDTVSFNENGGTVNLTVSGTHGTVFTLAVDSVDPAGWITSGALSSQTGTIQSGGTETVTLTIPSTTMDVNRVAAITATNFQDNTNTVTTGLFRQMVGHGTTGDLSLAFTVDVTGTVLSPSASIVSGDPPFTLELFDTDPTSGSPTPLETMTATGAATLSSPQIVNFTDIDLTGEPAGDYTYFLRVTDSGTAGDLDVVIEMETIIIATHPDLEGFTLPVNFYDSVPFIISSNIDPAILTLSQGSITVSDSVIDTSFGRNPGQYLATGFSPVAGPFNVSFTNTGVSPNVTILDGDINFIDRRWNSFDEIEIFGSGTNTANAPTYLTLEIYANTGVNAFAGSSADVARFFGCDYLTGTHTTVPEGSNRTTFTPLGLQQSHVLISDLGGHTGLVTFRPFVSDRALPDTDAVITYGPIATYNLA